MNIQYSLCVLVNRQQLYLTQPFEQNGINRMPLSEDIREAHLMSLAEARDAYDILVPENCAPHQPKAEVLVIKAIMVLD